MNILPNGEAVTIVSVRDLRRNKSIVYVVRHDASQKYLVSSMRMHAADRWRANVKKAIQFLDAERLASHLRDHNFNVSFDI